ncbi:hypothetical protein NQ176_g4015 [Zarea fungicola]|uniref:Uncharacterized protein n=1 Tax=Zarea fungicola TaxID=93591 RepID=A0ACC1NGI0_9HYPO|nr:hypothetical protein NQ176_g4015 [Lecanicillium fungicola]
MPTANLFFMAMILVQGGIEKTTFSLEERFSTTVSKGSPIGLAALNLVFVSVVKSLWVVIEEHIMALHTFRSLARRQQPAFPIFAREYARTPILGRTYRALRDGETMLATVTIVSLLLEVGLTCFGIAASMSQGQAFNADAAYAIHWVAFGVCVSMFFLSSLVLEGLMRRYIVVGRNPDTLGARLSYLCMSPLLLMDFGPIKAMNSKQRDDYLRSLPFLYSLHDIRYYTNFGQSIEVQGLERVCSGAMDA